MQQSNICQKILNDHFIVYMCIRRLAWPRSHEATIFNNHSGFALSLFWRTRKIAWQLHLICNKTPPFVSNSTARNYAGNISLSWCSSRSPSWSVGLSIQEEVKDTSWSLFSVITFIRRVNKNQYHSTRLWVWRLTTICHNNEAGITIMHENDLNKRKNYQVANFLWIIRQHVAVSS